MNKHYIFFKAISFYLSDLLTYFSIKTIIETIIRFYKPMLFGEQLLKQRKKLHLSAEELADRVKISRSYITLMENNKRLPSKKVIPSLAAALKVKTSVVINWYLEDIREKILKVSGSK